MGNEVYVGASRCDRELHDAEHLLGGLVAALRPLGEVSLACTHVVTVPWRHEAVSVAVSNADDEAVLAAATAAVGAGATVVVLSGSARSSAGPDNAGAAAAAESLRDRSGGRAVVFAGQERLLGELPLSEAVQVSDLDGVLSMAGEPAPDAVLVTRDHVRPELVGGRLLLRTQHEDPSRLVPWEPPVVHQCGGH
ncbi:hypothetical protein CLV35_2386 [Motilibacter peucedani]|uniref:Uncharacterized protein n=1 Tax=Motilibacter peucedani TaxID=598650 RepID=A0A420XNZ7_9ACTN|nr:hypothetical protein [Motilibacter peucedani]RKS73892.1 hypothetical protein CLV35_2386 [Motilibacter peucedani]